MLPQKSEIISSEETQCFKEDAANMPQITSIKLFGRTVSMVDTQKTVDIKYDETVENEKAGLEEESEKLVTQLSLGMCSGNCQSMEQQKESPCNVGECGSSLPCWSLYQGLPALSLKPCNHQILNPVPVRPCLKVRTREEESSCTGSNTGSVCDMENQSKNNSSDTDDTQSRKHHHEGVFLKKSGRGFVPYKRCVSERDENSLIVGLEEREGQRARVCS